MSDSNPNSVVTTFLEQNQQEFAELLTFIDFAEGLTIGFIEVNQAGDAGALVTALQQHFAQNLPQTKIQLAVFNFSRMPDLRFLRDALLERLKQIHLQPNRKLVLILQGLEVAIGTDGIGEYPPLLQDLNFVRDAYSQTVPHPLLFILPDYAITRVSRYAPDFWAWKSGLFHFQTSAQSLERLQSDAFERPLPFIASSENQEQIEQLKQLLMEYHPSGQQIAPENISFCSEIYYKIGSAYLTQHQPDKARDYLQEGLKLMQGQSLSLLSQSLQRTLGNAYEDLRQFEEAIAAYNSALEIAQALEELSRVAITLVDLGDVARKQRQFKQAQDFYYQSLAIHEQQGDRYSQAVTYHNLGMVAQDLRQFEEARRNYQQALEIKIEFGDRYSQASTYHQLGVVAQDLRQFEEARRNYQKALEIDIEFGDLYSQASTYHQLGWVAQDLRQFEEARRNYKQALEIDVEFGNLYSQASTYHQLGVVAQKLREFEEARRNYQQALEIKIKFGDRYSQARTYHQLGWVAQDLQEFEEAQHNYQQALEIKIEFGDRYSQARTYHQLGRILQSLREFEEARRNYQQALEIDIEFGDRYSQALTYYQIGKLAEAEDELEEAITYYLLEFEIMVEFNDRYELDISLGNLARFYSAHPSPDLLNQIAQRLNKSTAEVEELFASMNKNS